MNRNMMEEATKAGNIKAMNHPLLMLNCTTPQRPKPSMKSTQAKNSTPTKSVLRNLITTQ